jgi:hypothetical protein
LIKSTVDGVEAKNGGKRFCRWKKRDSQQSFSLKTRTDGTFAARKQEPICPLSNPTQ